MDGNAYPEPGTQQFARFMAKGGPGGAEPELPAEPGSPVQDVTEIITAANDAAMGEDLQDGRGRDVAETSAAESVPEPAEPIEGIVGPATPEA